MTSNTASVPSRRERMRAETMTEIKASARGQLLEHGPSGISLRAVARDVGVSPAALYRYFDNLDALLTDLCCDFYDELVDASRAAMEVHPAEAHPERMKAWVWTFRSWVVSHRREFELMLNVPESESALTPCVNIADVPFDDLPAVTRKSMEHARLCGRELAAYYRHTEGQGFDFSAIDIPEISKGLSDELLDQCADMVIGERLPLPWIYAFASAWVRVFGLVTMEAFGSLPVRDNIEEFYKVQLMSMMRDFGIA
ncbi:TetR/AcrR family transcriptional regulator [Glycomyces xiaoerkulensis]|uniref:TetR/AcrR family transcriptional regulator n=1 Tax=Glycomyces xiaoerkulensis TaxID=2038139 RepID=UPI0012FFDBE8|nr:TetR/AcrR family transcriptional regulator [Glycomyces xiaoerkulensis]